MTQKPPFSTKQLLRSSLETIESQNKQIDSLKEQLTTTSAALLSSNRRLADQDEEILRLRELVRKQTTDWQRQAETLRGKLRAAVDTLTMIVTRDRDLHDD